MASGNHIHRITITASTEKLAEVRQFVALHAHDFGFSKPHVADIRLAVDEAFTNIVNHAYNNDEQQQIEITLRGNGNTFGISLFDTGKPFSLADYEHPDVEEKIKHKKRGGVGVYLIRQLMDEVTYRHEGVRNEIQMTKKRA